MKPEGVFTALISPMTRSGAIDYSNLRDLVRRQVKAGVSGIMPVGTTGESPTVTDSEKLKITEIVLEEAGGKLKVFSGAGSYDTHHTVRLTQEMKRLGVDGTLQVSPYYNRPTPEGIYRHFQTIADKTDLPLIVYNVPGRTGSDIDTATLLRLAKDPRIIAVKDASGNVPRMIEILNRKPGDFSFFSGDDQLAFTAVTLGGQGVISVISNLFPEESVRWVSAALAGDFEKARRGFYRLFPFMQAAFWESNPIPVKAAMEIRGLTLARCRLPLTSMSPSLKKKLRLLLDRL